MTAFLFDRQALIFVIQKGNDYMNATVKKLFAAVLITTTCLFAAGCGSSSNSGASGDKKEIKMGVTAGPHAEVIEEVAKEAAKQGITIKVVEFNDYVQPNKALAEGDLDMNSMQHQPYMDNVVKKQGLKITSIGKTIILPMAVYSHKYKDIKDVADGAKVTIPNDPTNGARALLLIQQAGLIKLKNGNSVDASVTDITENPKNLQFVELDAAQIPPFPRRHGPGLRQHQLRHPGWLESAEGFDPRRIEGFAVCQRHGSPSGRRKQRNIQESLRNLPVGTDQEIHRRTLPGNYPAGILMAHDS